jgi:hypothetical protein
MAALCYALIIAAAYSLSLSSGYLAQAVEGLLESRRQLLVSPPQFRTRVCSSPDPVAKAGEGLKRGFGTLPQLRCERHYFSRSQGAWQPICRTMERPSEAFSPRFYRLSMVCTYHWAGNRVDLPRVNWEIFR